MADEWLTQQFEEHRAHLRAVAVRMLGSTAEADDAVQEAWLRLHRAGADEVDNLGGWLTTVVSRICLNMLRTRGTRREQPLEGAAVERDTDVPDPEHEAVLADSVGLALLVVLDTLTPAERLAFVLHDLFALPFEEIAPIIERTPAAARQLASRARRRVQGAQAPDADPGRQRQVVSAFLAASRAGDFAGLLALLDPDVVLRADGAAVQMGAEAIVRGAADVAETFSGRARAARLALVDGAPGLAWLRERRPLMVFDFVVQRGRIVAIELVADADVLESLEVDLVD
jgi:RNA polymerase sigma-70 factor (ECF subfamily)